MKNKTRQTILIVSAIVLLAAFVIIVMYFSNSKDNEKTKIGYVMTGSTDEHGWNGMNYKGIETVCANLGLELMVKENVLEGTGKCTEAVSELAEGGAEMIILSSFGYPGEVTELIDSYPEISFYGISSQYYSENMSSYFGRMYQMRYLTGIIAGMITESDNIGYVAAMANDEVNRGINAFTLGVRRVNPDAVVNVMWTDSWDDEAKAKSAANSLIADGADVLAYHQNQPYVVEAADEAGVYSIGYNEAAEGFSDKYLTAAVWDWEHLYYDIITEFLQGKANIHQHHWCGMETGAIALSEFSPLVTEEIRAEVEKAKAEILAGNDVFSGEIYDNTGTKRCGADEFISDTSLISDFDWYVDGVIICE
ncbi:MAG: BMP family ABC transporter substrate-binding protein [Oscillospiraceae bacterium]|nr:BMP family ABC transporter substrate-binding protein [Oscillospiraceae bacterium]